MDSLDWLLRVLDLIAGPNYEEQVFIVPPQQSSTLQLCHIFVNLNPRVSILHLTQHKPKAKKIENFFLQQE